MRTEATQLVAGEDSAEEQELLSDQAGTGSLPEVSGQVPMAGTSTGTADESLLQGTGAAPVAETADLSGSDEAAGPEGRVRISAIPLASLVVLVLGGLVFFVVLQPRSRKKTTQRKRSDI